MTKLDVLKLCGLEALRMVIELFVDLAFIHEVREELTDLPLPRNEHEHGHCALTGRVVDDYVQIVDGFDEFLTGLLPQPQEKLVHQQDHAAKSLGLGVLSHPSQSLRPLGIDACRSSISSPSLIRIQKYPRPSQPKEPKSGKHSIDKHPERDVVADGDNATKVIPTLHNCC